MKQRLLKAITALTLSAAMLLPADTLPVSAHAAETLAEENVCNIDGYHVHDEYEIDNPVEVKYLEPEQYAAGTVSAPKASKKSGTITCSKNSASIKLTADSGATIYYSLNGGSYKKYSSAIKLTKNSTIKAYATKNGTKSSVVTYSYKLKPKVSFSASDSGSAKTVKLSSGTNSVKFYYTTDGSKPTTKSKLYTSSGITLTKSCQLRVLAVKSGWSNAGFSKNYTVNSSAGTSSSSSDTKQLGAGSFTTPSTGKATVRYNGNSKTVDAKHYAQFGYGFSRECDAIEITVSSEQGQYIGFDITPNAKFSNGNTLTLSELKVIGNSRVSLMGFGLNGSSTVYTDYDTELFDKVELKAVDMDYTAAKPSTIYFYILAHDASGKKISFEGLAKVYMTGSKHATTSGSGSGGTGNSGNTGSSGGSGGTSANSTDKIITKGSDTRECKACSNGLCWDCNGAGRVYDYIFGYTKCLTCDSTGYCKVCSGTRKITVEVNVINENAVPEGKTFKKCTNCLGSGVCPYCNGGKICIFTECFHCRHTGICGFCNGSGGTLTDKPDPNTGGSSSGSGSSSGGSSSGNSGGSTSSELNICFTCGGTGTCNICHGTDICQACFGRGGQSYNTWGQGGSGWVDCSACNGSKKCKYCTLGKCKTCGGTGMR